MQFGSYCSCKKEIYILTFERRTFYQLDNDNQQLLKFCTRYVGVCYDRPVTLLNAAKYAKKEYDKVTDKAIKNAFMEAYLRISLDSGVIETLVLTIINL